MSVHTVGSALFALQFIPIPHDTSGNLFSQLGYSVAAVVVETSSAMQFPLESLRYHSRLLYVLAVLGIYCFNVANFVVTLCRYWENGDCGTKSHGTLV
jgi:hypothetical protein